MIITGLFVILLLVLILPFSFKKVEHNLEAFLFIMGIAATLISKQMSWHLGLEAITDPIPITLAVLVFGIVFKWSRRFLDTFITKALNAVSLSIFVFLLIFILGSLASVITAIIASLVLVEIISMLQLDKKHETRIVIIACFSIGLGAVLTPIGEPLSTIATAKLAGPPYHAGFFFLAKIFWPWVISGVLLLGLLAAGYVGRKVKISESLTE